MGFGEHNSDTWRLGIVDALQERRARYESFAYKAPVVVNQPTPSRLVGVPTPPEPPPPVRMDRPTPSSEAATIARIIMAVCKAWNVSPGELRSDARPKWLSRPRFAGYRLARMMTKWSYPRIAKGFGKADHTSVLHGIRRAQVLHDTDPDWRARYDAAVEELKLYVAPLA